MVRFIRAFGVENLYLNCLKNYSIRSGDISIPSAAFKNSMALIPTSELAVLYAELEQKTGDPDYVVKSMAPSPLDHTKMISRWILSAQDVTSCVRRFNNGVSCLHSGATLQGSQIGNIIKWSYDVTGLPSDARVHDSTRFSIFMVKLLREYLGEHYTPVRVLLCGTRTNHSLYESFFGCEVVWSHHKTEVWLSNEDRLYVNQKEGRKTQELAMTYSDLDSLLDMPNPDELLKTVSELIKYARYYGLPTVERVAGFMGLSTQQLQRKLNAEGANFTVLFNYVLGNYAAEQLTKGRTPQEVATSIGYTHVASFNRMFKKQRGITPLEYVDRHQ
ncbi:AraC family transcriptional regulator [Vibrio astriarenae]|uniref:AraC family transcriptional regulator n=1 Tax=Vibrio astriarenae TaxID=1481923 RepID=UPI00373537AE